MRRIIVLVSLVGLIVSLFLFFFAGCEPPPLSGIGGGRNLSDAGRTDTFHDVGAPEKTWCLIGEAPP